MTTEKQNEANRINAQKSTGPRTDEGKQRSSQNALKHGLLAKRSVIPGEDPAEFDALVTWFENTFQSIERLRSLARPPDGRRRLASQAHEPLVALRNAPKPDSPPVIW
jgi:hypothetical protein